MGITSAVSHTREAVLVRQSPKRLIPTAKSHIGLGNSKETDRAAEDASVHAFSMVRIYVLAGRILDLAGVNRMEKFLQSHYGFPSYSRHK